MDGIRVLQIGDGQVFEDVYRKNDNNAFQRSEGLATHDRNQLKNLFKAKDTEQPTLVVYQKGKSTTALKDGGIDRQVKAAYDAVLSGLNDNPEAKVGFVALHHKDQKFKLGSTSQAPDLNKVHGIGRASKERLLLHKGEAASVPIIPRAQNLRQQIAGLLDYFDAAIKSDGKMKFQLIGDEKRGKESEQLQEAAMILSEPSSLESVDKLRTLIKKIEDPLEQIKTEYGDFHEGMNLAGMIVAKSKEHNANGGLTVEEGKSLLKDLMQKRGIELVSIRDAKENTLLHEVRTLEMATWLRDIGLLNLNAKNLAGQTAFDLVVDAGQNAYPGENIAELAAHLNPEILKIKLKSS